MSKQEFKELKVGDTVRSKETKTRHWVVGAFHDYVRINAGNENFGLPRGVRLEDCHKWQKE